MYSEGIPWSSGTVDTVCFVVPPAVFHTLLLMISSVKRTVNQTLSWNIYMAESW